MLDTTPLDPLGTQQARLLRRDYTVSVLSTVILLLVGLIAYAYWRGLPIHYIPQGGPGISQPGVIPDAMALDYASDCLVLRYTFTPATFQTKQQAMRSCLHPRLLLPFKAQVESETALVKKYQLAAQAAIESQTIVQRTAERVTVQLTGRLTLWVGGRSSEEPLQATIDVVPWGHEATKDRLVLTRVHMAPEILTLGH